MLAPVLTTRPTQNALFVMADLAEAESGDHGRAREWVARAVRAPRDPVWTADGVVLEHWAPLSPVSGRIDAVEWKVPVAEIAGPSLDLDEATLLRPEPAAIVARPEARTGETPDTAIPVHAPPPFASVVSAAPPTTPDTPGPIAAADAAAIAHAASPSGGNGAAAPLPPREPDAPRVAAPGVTSFSPDEDVIEPALVPRLPDDPGVPGDIFEDERRGIAR